MNIFPLQSIAVIFSTKRSNVDAIGYAQMAEAMVKLAKQQDGFLGIDSVRDGLGHGITISYWRDDSSAKAWRDNDEHKKIREKGRAIWYDAYSLHVTKIERAYDWKRDG